MSAAERAGHEAKWGDEHNGAPDNNRGNAPDDHHRTKGEAGGFALSQLLELFASRKSHISPARFSRARRLSPASD